MKKLILLLLVIGFLLACRKRSSKFTFSGVWEIQKVEQMSYVDDSTLFEIELKSDTLGWFALQNYETLHYKGKMQINFASISGLSTDYQLNWGIDEHNSDRIYINNKFYTRSRYLGGEKWTWISGGNSGENYTRETVYVKHK